MEEGEEIELEGIVTENGTNNSLYSEDALRPLIAQSQPVLSPSPQIPTEVNERLAATSTRREVTAFKDTIRVYSAPQSQDRESGIVKYASNEQLRRANTLDLEFRVDSAPRFNTVENVPSSCTQHDYIEKDNSIGSYGQRLNSQLLNAVTKQNLQEIVSLLGEGANPNATCRLSHLSACHIAALNGGEALPLLLKAGAKADRFDNVGRTPLYLAVWAGNIKEITLLLGFPEELQTRVCDKEMSSETEDEVKQLIPSISNMTNAVREPGVNNILPRTWMDGMSHACKDFDKNIPLLEAKWTPLHAASFSARAHCVRLLLAAGADPDAEDLKGHIPLEVVGCTDNVHEIGSEELTETIKLLVKALSRNNEAHVQEVKTYSPLHKAIEVGSVDSITLLLKAGVALTLQKDGLTPMHLCVKKELKEHFQLLASHHHTHNGSAIDCRDKDGFTVLHASVRSGWIPGIRIALAAGSSITIKANNGETALHDAALLGNLDVLNELLEVAKIRGVVDCTNKKRETALFIAVREGNLECVQKLLKDGASMKQTLPPPQNTSVLHKAAEKGHLEILKYFIENHTSETKAIINSRAKYEINKHDITPLHLAVIYNRSECIKMLLSKREDLDLRIYKAFTPLNYAVIRNNTEISRLILKCDKTILNSVGGAWDPLHMACRNSSRECIKLLLEEGADLSKPIKNTNITALKIIVNNISKPKEFMTDIFDSCISMTTVRNESKIGIKIDYSILTPNNEKTEQMRVVQALCDTGNRYDQKNLLLHPLIESFLYLKWNALLPYFYTIIIFHSIYVISFTILLMNLFSYKNADPPALMNTTIWIFILYVAGGVVCILETIMLFKVKYVTYLEHVETWVKAFYVPLGMVLMPILMIKVIDISRSRHLCSVGVLISWMQMMFLFSRFPGWGYYFLIFGRVTSKILKILLTFIFLLIGFSLAFVIENESTKPFENFWSAIFKTIVMMTSEFDYGNLFENKDPVDNATIFFKTMFIIFIILIAIVLMNLMVGVAVDDVRDLKLIGNIDRIEKQIDLLTILESLVHSNILKKILPKYVTEIIQNRACVANSLFLLPLKNENIFPPHIIDAITDMKSMKNQNDSELYKSQINEMHNTIVIKKELKEKSNSKSDDTREKKEKISEDEFRQQINTRIEQMNTKINAIEQSLFRIEKHFEK